MEDHSTDNNYTLKEIKDTFLPNRDLESLENDVSNSTEAKPSGAWESLANLKTEDMALVVRDELYALQAELERLRGIEARLNKQITLFSEVDGFFHAWDIEERLRNIREDSEES